MQSTSSSLSLSLEPDSLYISPFLYRECLFNRPPARRESSGRKYARVWSSGGTGVPGGPQNRRGCSTAVGMRVGGSEKAACPANTSASWIAKVRGSKMQHKPETFRGSPGV